MQVTDKLTLLGIKSSIPYIRHVKLAALLLVQCDSQLSFSSEIIEKTIYYKLMTFLEETSIKGVFLNRKNLKNFTICGPMTVFMPYKHIVRPAPWFEFDMPALYARVKFDPRIESWIKNVKMGPTLKFLKALLI